MLQLASIRGILDASSPLFAYGILSGTALFLLASPLAVLPIGFGLITGVSRQTSIFEKRAKSSVRGSAVRCRRSPRDLLVDIPGQTDTGFYQHGRHMIFEQSGGAVRRDCYGQSSAA